MEVFDVIDAFEMWKDGDLEAVTKYILRAGRKGSRLEDLEKARMYLDRAILRESRKAVEFVESSPENIEEFFRVTGNFEGELSVT